MLLKLAASKVKSVASTILMNRDLHNVNLAAILWVSVRLIENRLAEIFSVNREPPYSVHFGWRFFRHRRQLRRQPEDVITGVLLD